MSVVNLFQTQYFMVSVLILHDTTIWTNWLFTGHAIVRNLGFVLRTVLWILKALSFQRAQCKCNIVQKTAVHKLIHSERASAMRTLLFCFSNPLFKARTTRKLAAAGTHDRLVKLAVANEAFQQFFKVELVFWWWILRWILFRHYRQS